jgi:radical SAM protein with 4Fe4S-binding SPASM domain
MMIVEEKSRTSPEKETGLVEQIRLSGLHPPETMTLMVTDVCNLTCRHCWLDCGSLQGCGPVDLSDLMAVVDAFAALGGTRLILSGGEFFSHPEWRAILEFCLDHSALDGICLQTNGTLISAKHAKVLKAMPLEKLTIQVSLDGARHRTHVRVRGTGSYFRVMTGLRLLVEAGLGEQLQVAFTEMAHNILELPELLETIDKMGIGRLISSTLVKGGRAADSTRMSLPTPAQFWELIHFYQTDAEFKKLYDRKATISAIEWFKNRAGSADGTCACLKNIFVDVRGRIFPCTMLLLDAYASESVYARPMVRVIRQALAQWRSIPVLSRKRQRLLQPCLNCVGRAHCGGGCMGRAVTTYGTVMAPEDRCSLRKAVYHWALLPGVGSFCSRG